MPSTRTYTVSHAPRLRVIDGLVSDTERARLDALGGAWDRFAAQGLTTAHGPTGFSVELPRAFDPLLAEVAGRIEDALGCRDESDGWLRFRRYSVGEAHPAHLDAYELQGLTLVTTAMLVLQAPDAGGETRFPDAASGPLALRPVAGRLLVWTSFDAEGRLDPTSRHDALPVTAGQKCTLTLFLYRRDRRVDLPDGLDLTGELGALS